MRTPLLITIPFVLMLNADRVIVSTQMYGDLSGIRHVQAVGDSSLRYELHKWMHEMTPGFDNAGSHISGDTVVISRSRQVNDLGAPADAQAQALDIVQKPLSLVTTYTWTETVTIEPPDNERERAAAPLTRLEYRVTMPGSISSTNPPAQVTGRTAVWTLSGDHKEQVISVTASAVRWDVVVVLVYVVGYLVFRIVAFLVHRARLRPRKI